MTTRIQVAPFYSSARSQPNSEAFGIVMNNVHSPNFLNLICNKLNLSSNIT